MRRAAIGIASGVLAGACVDLDPYAGSADAQCQLASAQGWCEDVGYCSYPDDECSSGRRYGELAAGLAGQCVDAAGTTASGDTTGVCCTGAVAVTGSGAVERPNNESRLQPLRPADDGGFDSYMTPAQKGSFRTYRWGLNFRYVDHGKSFLSGVMKARRASTENSRSWL